ncbi:MAG: polynucleotide adenylyltransferase PcnB [Succinivibrio sp.]|nr:polynucleotide adenylyltransferase PcnB [Succinivibrio sp.]
MKDTKITAPKPSLEDVLAQNKEQVRKHGSAKLVLARKDHPISRKNFSRQALKVLEGLSHAGFQAYLVGGCIRDLLTNKVPKDFDVSTNATPEQVRRVFRNSRIIGRRFKIVHVVFANEIIEVTTFRSMQDGTERRGSGTRVSDDSGMLVRDNVYGKSLEEDAQRRDFTINAIYYDIKTFELIDFHGGFADLKARVIDIIGDPEVRYLEDPVRMIRALRFAAKLGFKLSRRTSEPIRKLADNLRQVSNARLYEEVNKLFLTGHGLQSYHILREYGLFEILFPGLEAYFDNPAFNSFVEAALKSSDARYAQNKRNMPHFLYAVILWFKYQEEVFNLEQFSDCLVSDVAAQELRQQAFNNVMQQQQQITAIPMAILSSIRSMWMLQYLLLDTTESHTSLIVSRSLFRGGFDIFKVRGQFEPYLEEYIRYWQPYYDKSAAQASKKKLERESSPGPESAPAKESAASFGKDSGQSRKDRLEKARAWRAAMHLDP